MVLSNAEIEKIVKHLKNEYSEDRKTANGKYIQYAKAIVTSLDGLELSYKPSKGLGVKVGNTRIQLKDVEDSDDFKNVGKHWESLTKISKKLPASKKGSTSKITVL